MLTLSVFDNDLKIDLALLSIIEDAFERPIIDRWQVNNYSGHPSKYYVMCFYIRKSSYTFINLDIVEFSYHYANQETRRSDEKVKGQ